VVDCLRFETAVWDALASGDAPADAALLADDFLGVYASGMAGKSSHVDPLRDGPTVDRYVLSEVTTRALTSELVLIAYRADFTRQPGGDEESMYVTSIWRHDGSTWRNVFSQDTATLGRRTD
jgi:hypothetical protein